MVETKSPGDENLHISFPSEGLCTLTLNRVSKKNALNPSLVSALAEALENLPQNPTVKVCVLTGAGGSFCSGADLSSIDAEDDAWEQRIDEFHRLILGIVRAPQPVIAALEGPAVGFGADLALCCDMRIMAKGSYVEEGFIKIGLMPDGGGTYFMEKFLGPRAFEALALGVRYDDATCLSEGIANAVVEQGLALDKALGLATRLSACAPLSLREIKSALRARDRMELPAALKRERTGQARLLRSEDFREGVAAFLEKRSPRFTGR